MRGYTNSMTTTQNITDSSFITSAGHRVNTQIARCATGDGRIERSVGANHFGDWYHMSTGLARCQGHPGAVATPEDCRYDDTAHYDGCPHLPR